jgi:hypothetical protein
VQKLKQAINSSGKQITLLAGLPALALAIVGCRVNAVQTQPDATTIASSKQYSAGSARRDAHPKSHGCVKAEIHILDTRPAPLAKGMFIPGKTYQAWIRYDAG